MSPEERNTMVNSPAHRHLLGPLQREDIQEDEVKDAKMEEAEEEGGDEQEEEEDEDETEIQRLIRISQHHLLRPGDSLRRNRIPQSFSAHANLGMKERRPKMASGRYHLEASAEEDEVDDGEEEEEEDEEDSDEELFTAHNSLLPLRKSKSAFAGFQSSIVKSTKPFACSVIVKKGEEARKREEEEEDEEKEIAELIDLRRGDVLEFRVDDKRQQRNEEEEGEEANCPSSLGQIGRTGSCWSAPACADESEGELSSSSASSENEEEEIGRGRRRRRGKNRGGRKGGSDWAVRRKETSWSAPSQFCDYQMGMEEDEEREEANLEEEEEEELLRWKRRRSVRIREDSPIREDMQKQQREGGSAGRCEEGRDPYEGIDGEEEEGNEGEEEGEGMAVAEPTNMKCLEMDDQPDEVMSTGEDEEEEDDEKEEEEEEEERRHAANLGKHMRVFVHTNNQMAACHRRRHHQMPSSRSDSQLLWHRHSAPAAPPPPPAPFPMDEKNGKIIEEDENGPGIWTFGGEGGMPHSRTYGGFSICAGREEELEEEKGQEEREMQLKLDELEKKMMSQQHASGQNDKKTMDISGNSLIKYGGKIQEKREEKETAIINGDEGQCREAVLGERPERLNLSRQLTPGNVHHLGSDDLIPMADDCPTPNLFLMPGYLPLPLGRRKRHSKSTALMDNSLSSSSYYSEEDEEGDMGGGKGMRRRGRALMQRSAAARLCRRGSPPMAQLELMSESEISELEQQIASGRLIKSYTGTTSCAQEEGGGRRDGEEGDGEERREEDEEGRANEEGEEGKGREEGRDEDEKAEEEEGRDDKWKNGSEGEGGSGDDVEDEEANCREDRCQKQICGSYSMPSMLNDDQRPAPLNNYWGPGYVRPDFWRNECPIGEEGPSWEEEAAHPSMHRSLTVQNEFDGGTRRRRMLPLRPDQIDLSASMQTASVPHSHHPHLCNGQYSTEEDYHHRHHHYLIPAAALGPSSASPSHQLTSPDPLLQCQSSLSQSFSAKRRQLPKTPPSLEDPLDKIDIAIATKEYLLSVLHQTQQQRNATNGEKCQKQRQLVEMEPAREDGGGNREENFEDYSPTIPVLPSPSLIQRPILPLLPLQHQQIWQNGHHSQKAAPGPDEQYTLSYGMDQSVLKHARRPMSIEGSFYEDMDGLNGNLAGGYYSAREQQRKGGGGGWDGTDDLIYTPEDEGERRRVSAYNLADGAKSSSGISSCCTTSSRSNDPAESDFQARRQRRAGKMLPAPDDPNAPTHRVQFPFMPRHADELALEKGDALHIIDKFDDHWCFGLNLRSGQKGIFPEAHIVEIDLVDEICRSVLPDMNHHQGKERDTFYLTMLASIEVAHHKGNDVLVQAINKVCSMYQRKEEILVPQTVLMEVSFRGIHVIDKRKKDIFRCPTFDFFYSLQNISFCGAHPKELRYFGFITKHPLLPRFACHVFLSNESTQSIVEAIGRAFKRSYDEYMAFAHPTEDIFLE